MKDSAFGLNPNQAYMTKLYITVNFVNAFGYSYPKIIDTLLGTKRSFTNKLIKKGILEEEKISRPIPQMPAKVIKLTGLGKSFVKDTVNTRKPNLNNLYHDYVTQKYVALLTRNKNYKVKVVNTQKITERLRKNYDSVVMSEDKTIAIETELSPKKPKQAHINLYKILSDLRQYKDIEVHFISTSKRALTPYLSIKESGELKIYEKNQQSGKYIYEKTIKIDDELLGRLKFRITS